MVQYPPLNYNVYKGKRKNQDVELQLYRILSHLLNGKVHRKKTGKVYA